MQIHRKGVADPTTSQLLLLVISVIHAKLYLECLCDLLHDSTVRNMPSLLTQILLIDCLHLFSQSQTVPVQPTAFRNEYVGGKMAFLICPASQRHYRNHWGMLVCTVVAHDDCWTDAALLIAIYVLTEIHKINIASFTHTHSPKLNI